MAARVKRENQCSTRKPYRWSGAARPSTLETGRIARQADGAVLATYGETVVAVRRDRRQVGQGRAGFPSRSPSTIRKSSLPPDAFRVASSSVNAALTEKETLTSRLNRPSDPPAVPPKVSITKST